MTPADPDSLSRTAKIFADSGEAATLQDADALLNTFVLQLHVGHGVADNRSRQAAVLTIVNTAVRAFKGGVHVQVVEDAPLTVGWRHGHLISAAVVYFGGTVVDALAQDYPTICVGDTDAPVPGHPVLRATFDGWSAGVVEGVNTPLLERDLFVPAGIAAAGIAVAEAFEFRRGRNVYMGRRSQGISLWKPGTPWLDAEAVGPEDVTYAPSAWWLVGLGHLGQSYLWSIGMLPFALSRDVRLMLHDDDVVTTANESTGLLLTPGSIVNEQKKHKTRALADVLEARGFTTTVSERRLQPADGPVGEEPRLALIGVDNPFTRSQLSQSGFALVVDAGLGGGPTHYLDLQLRTFPGPRRSEEVAAWREEPASSETLLDLPAYRDRTHADGDRCGAVEIAGRSVAASFVGATAGALVIAEAVRTLRGEHRYAVIDGTLRGLDDLRAVTIDDDPIPNTGYTTLVGQ